MFVSILLFLIIFCILVISHEFGHFIIAKKNGIHVVEFFVGLGPSLFSFERGGTKYSLKLLPLGGACVFEGADGLADKEKELSEGAFLKAPVWSRFATVLAGPLFNFLAAYIFAIILVSTCGVSLPVIQEVMEESGAMEAGLLAGDRIIKIDGKNMHTTDEVSFASAMNADGAPMTVTYLRDGHRDTTVIIPKYSEENGRYMMGISNGEFLKCNVLQTFEYGFYTMNYYAKATFESLGMLVTGRLNRNDVAGPIGVVKVVDETYDYYKQFGISQVVLSMLNIALLLSVNLGIMNLLPLPALDGGRLVFLLIEALRGKPIPPEKEGIVHLAGMIALGVLMVCVFYNDIMKFF